jgi:branched-chain amino acid transport system substrate-binding protein
MKRAFVILLAVAATAALAPACTSQADPVRVGAIYPLSGPDGGPGTDEHNGVLLAADLVNDDGGVQGRPVEIDSLDVAGPDGAPGAVEALSQQGVSLVLGSYGSPISEVVARETATRGMLFWETGAVGMLPFSAERGTLTFRVPPTGGTLGRAAISFVAGELASKLHRDPRSLTFAISYVDDVYGRTVADGAAAALRARGLRLVERFGYDFRTLDADALADRIAAAKPEVLFVSGYIKDAIALRRALVTHHVPLLASIGTSSSYCMPAFGRTLGKDAVGLFASDKPDAWVMEGSGLSGEADALLYRADEAYRDLYGKGMSAAALTGFSSAWALLLHVLPDAAELSPSGVATAARAADLPMGSLPNGSGLKFGAPGTPGAGDNLRAMSVIWEWVAPGKEVVVWPPEYASRPTTVLQLAGSAIEP